MQIRYFAHSWLSDWNNGNAHFLRGLASALVRRGHQVRLYEPMPEPRGGWSLRQLWDEPAGAAAVRQMRRAFPELDVRLFTPGADPAASAPGGAQMQALGLAWVRSWEDELQGAEIVLAHEWNPPELFHWLLAQRRRYGFRLLLHDTHHRAWSEPAMLERLPLASLDGVLAFGESLRRIYERHGRAQRTYTLHEAADSERFRPPATPMPPTDDVIWIGNWGDEERTRELDAYLFAPTAAAGVRTQVYGVRYPEAAQARLAAAGIAYGGYLPNLAAPAAYAQAAVTIHVPRRPYAAALPGIPTIRMFEALACGMPLLSAPWADSEALLESGADYWPAHSSAEMTALLTQLLSRPEQRMRMGRQGAATIVARHTCAHRALTLEAICHDLA